MPHDDVPGIAYKLGPLAIGAQNPQKEGDSYFENLRDGQNVKYTIYYDADFYNSDYLRLWSGRDGGRDDLCRFRASTGDIAQVGRRRIPQKEVYRIALSTEFKHFTVGFLGDSSCTSINEVLPLCGE